jgi:predicted MPP superfamily phosphohydrolase
MATRIIVLSIVFLIYALIEVYVYQGISAAFKAGIGQKIARISYFTTIAITLAGFASVFYGFSTGMSNGNLFSNMLTGIAFSFIVTKLVFIFVLFGEDIYRVIRYAVEQVGSWFSKDEGAVVSFEGRRKFVSQIGLAIAAIPFSGFLYGIVKGKYDFRVLTTVLEFEDLPEAFDGFRIAQISDVHSGSFDSHSSVAKGVQMLQDENADLILFTGDLVNNKAHEIEPYLDLFSNLSAPHGKFSILGNHDYGDYVQWPSPEAKVANLDGVKGHHKTMGFELMNNANTRIEKDGQSIRLAGVENWGTPPFPQHGDLDHAYHGTGDNEFNILMSHDPSHWDMEVRDYHKKVHLTLSGHTHGMQFGIEIPGIKWSPVKYRYPRWGGLYEEGGQYIYVNRGFGFLGFPGRVGIWPEITVIELKRKVVV